MKEISISSFKATCLEQLRNVARTGEPLTVTRRGEPIAQVVPLPPSLRGRAWLGSGRSTGRIHGDLVEPLDAEWEALA